MFRPCSATSRYRKRRQIRVPQDQQARPSNFWRGYGESRMFNKIANLSVGKRLFLGFGLVLALTAGIGLIGWNYTHTMSDEFDHLYTDNLKSAVHLANAERGLWELRFGIANY